MEQKYFSGLSPLGFHRIAYTAWSENVDPVPVICVHGLTRNGRDFDTLADALSKSHPVFCPDIVGRGKSDWLKDGKLYNYTQYLADMTALIARTGASQVDWVGTSMGGILGMLLAAAENSPIRRLLINDVGPLITLQGLKRIANYVSLTPEFSDEEAVIRYMRTNYGSFGIQRNEDWQHMARFGTRVLPNGKLTLGHDPAIGDNFRELTDDVSLWGFYDRIRCPTLVIHGELSDILNSETVAAMKLRGPRAEVVEIPKVGHAPALLDQDQIKIIERFLTH